MSRVFNMKRIEIKTTFLYTKDKQNITKTLKQNAKLMATQGRGVVY